MSLIEQIKLAYTELKDSDFEPSRGVINLQDDSDGQGAYISKWEYSKPIPEGFKLGK